MRLSDELLLTGRPVPTEPELTALVAVLRSLGAAPAPAPTSALAQVLREGLPASPVVSLSGHRRRRSARSTLVKMGIAAVVVAGVATGAAALAPESVREPARSLITGVVEILAPWTRDPVDLPAEPADPVHPAEPVTPVTPGESPHEGVTPPDKTARPEPPAEGRQHPVPPKAPSTPPAPPAPPSDPGRPDEPGRPGDEPGAAGNAQGPTGHIADPLYPYPSTGGLR